MSSQVDQAVAQSFHLSLRQKGMFLAVLSAIFLAAMDQTVVATALPTIARDLHGLAHLPWVITAYLLSFTVTLPIYGKVGDLVGRKKVLLFAVTFFLLGSILSGLSWSLWSLVAFRALQGIGGGGIIVTAVASISDFIPLQQRGKSKGWWVPPSGWPPSSAHSLAVFLSKRWAGAGFFMSTSLLGSIAWQS